MDINRSEANYTFEINDVRDFIDSGRFRGSEFFFCRSMRFFVDLRYNTFYDGTPYLSAWLLRHNPSDNYYYSMKTSFEFRLVNWLGKSDKVERFNYVFKRDDDEACGNQKFINGHVLTYATNGWVKNNTLQFKVNLKCDRFYRTYGNK